MKISCYNPKNLVNFSCHNVKVVSFSFSGVAAILFCRKKRPIFCVEERIEITVKHSSHKMLYFFEALIALQLHVPNFNSPVGDKLSHIMVK